MNIRLIVFIAVLSLLNAPVSYADFSLKELQQIEKEEFKELLQAANSAINNNDFRKADIYIKIAFEKKHLPEDFKKSKLKPLVNNFVNSEKLHKKQHHIAQKRTRDSWRRLEQEEERIENARANDSCKLPRKPLAIENWGRNSNLAGNGWLIWGKSRILLSNGKVISGELDIHRGCYYLNTYGAYNVWAKNCGDDLNGQWKVTICMDFDNSFYITGDHTNVIEAAMKRL